MKKNSLKNTIFQFFFFFSILILGFLWAFQVLFLKQYYKYVKVQDIKTVAYTLKRQQKNKDITSIINNLAAEKGVCIEIMDSNYISLYNSSFFEKGCFTGKDTTMQYKFDFLNSNLTSHTYQLINPKFNNQTIVYALRLNNEQYAFINTSIEPIDKTVSILKDQLIIVTIIVFLLSFIIAYFFSNYISKPIIKLNKEAKKLAKGTFDCNFNCGSEIEEIKELESTLTYTQEELSQIEQYRQDFMANVSHDLKTPLTMIKAYAEMNRDLHQNDKEKQIQDMNIIIEEVDRLTLLVNDILTLSSMQAKMDEVEYEELDLIELIDTILNRYQILKETEHYHFLFQHKKRHLLIYADKKKLEQVIYNLINNAIQYTGEDNKVIVRVEEKENILVEITDTGNGIKEEEIPYIWDKYYKNKKKHKRALVGTGLGLSIVKHILELHHFKYGVKTKKGQGTTFYFMIPKKFNK